MAEIVLGVLGPAIELGKCIAEPIKRQFNYLCCLDSNVQGLRDEAKKLEDERVGLQMQVTTAENKTEVIDPKVETWLKDVNEIQEKMTGFESEITDIQGVACLAVKPRYSLSKRAKKTAEAMKQLREDCKFDPISHPPPPASMVLIPLGSTYEFESRKHIEEDIMMTLRGNKVNVIGICGMGGVGKTTMAKRVMNRMREEHLFDETVMVVVSHQVDMLRIQDDIAKSLGLELGEGSLSSKAHKISTRLVSGKRIVIVLDDVWENLKLEDLGIPCESGLKGCTVLLTSRNKGVLNEMGAQKVCEIQTLSEMEAWSLFKEKVGVCFDDQNMLSIAQDVVKECKGLPIAILSVAVALKDKKHKFIWEDALQQLKSSNPEDMPKVLEDVYKPLKLSYDSLDSQHAKSIFLLCCLFPEDDNIPLEHLTVYAVGLHMFESIRNVEQVRNRTYSLVEMLKSRFLLLDGYRKDYVKMHDVVRDVAIFIASEKERRLVKCGDNCTWISPFLGESIDKLSNGSTFPNLRLLLIDNSADKLQINDSFFEGKIELNVLSMKSASLRSLPNTTQFLKNLRTLILRSCVNLKTMSSVGELVNLEILICHHCVSIEQLPSEIMRLKCLRLLEISECRALKKISPGVISSLDKLGDLKIVQSFNKWEAEDEGKEKENAGLIELESLSNLTCLEIEVENPNLAAQHISLPPKIVKYNITIGSINLDYYYEYIGRGFEKKMSLDLPRDITLGPWIHKCARSVECMFLGGNGSNDLDLGQAYQNIKWLSLRSSSKTSSIVGRYDGATVVFPHLESLKLENLKNLEEICDIEGPILEVPSSSNYSFKSLKELSLVYLPALKRLWKRGPYQDNVLTLFSNLSSIYVNRCCRLCNLFPLSTAKDCFPQLKSLEIWSCKVMEQVFLWKEDANEMDNGLSRNHRHITFPKLEIMKLFHLPRLTAFCTGIESIEFPLLTHVQIESCPHLRSLVSSSGGISKDHDDDEDDHSLHLLCKPKVSFGNLRRLILRGDAKFKKAICPQFPIDDFTKLESLIIQNCGNIKSLFSFSIAKNLANLKHLTIMYCKRMEKVIESDDEGREDDGACELIGTILLIPNLKGLHLSNLPELKSFGDWRCALELPKLEAVEIKDCPKMGRYGWGSLITPNLKSLRIHRAHIVNTNDYLNDALQIESLEIWDCEMMEQVFLWSEEENEKDIIGQSSCNLRRITFPRLKSIDLYDLPKLTTFCKGFESIEFPLLIQMKINKCPNLKSLVSATTSSRRSGGINNDDDHSSHLFCNPKAVFGELKELKIKTYERSDRIPIDFFPRLEKLEILNCDQIFFSSPIAGNLINLKELIILACKEMVTVIEEEEEYSHESTRLFSHLEKLVLSTLPKLKIFCEWRCALQLPSLKEMAIYSCPKVERFSLGSLTTPNLKAIRIGSEYITITENLNDVLQQHFVKEESTSSKGQEDEIVEQEDKSTSSEKNESQEDQKKRKGEIEDELINFSTNVIDQEDE